MNNEVFENASEVILFMPRSQTRWIYTIDEGKQHVIIQDDIDNFASKYVPKVELKKLQDIILRHQPFIISVESKQIIELHKEENTQKTHREKIKKEINNVTKKSPENIFNINKSSDDMFLSMISKNFKI